MTELGRNWERDDLGGGQFRHTQFTRPVAYLEDGVYRRIAPEWIDSGLTERPHIVTAAPFLASVAPDGMRRIHPTREWDRYIEVGAPYIKTGGVWGKANLGTPARANGMLTWVTTNANMYVQFGGHYIKLTILLKTNWRPEDNQFAFPVGLTGLTRQGGQLLADGVPVMVIRAPHAEDYDNPSDIRPIAWDFVPLGGQTYVLFTLPALSTGRRWLIDPTLTLQPDATDGLDTYLQSNNPTFNRGTATDMQTGTTAGGLNRRGLIEFDISSIPAGSTINSSLMGLRCSAEASATDYTVGAHRSLVQWYEGNQNGAAPPAGEDGSSWSNRNQNPSNIQAWSGGAGGGSGSDFTAGATGSVSITGTGSFFDFDITTDVAAWHSGAATNHGSWIVNASQGTNGSSKSFDTSDSATPANRPRLVTIYTLAAGRGLFTIPFAAMFQGAFG